jgi:tetratricopeptide (TPR) repeat protein
MPPELCSLIDKALSADASARPHTAAEWLERMHTRCTFPETRADGTTDKHTDNSAVSETGLSDTASATAISFANLGLAFQLLHHTHDAMLCYSSAAEYWQQAGKRPTQTLLYNWGLCHLHVKNSTEGRRQLQRVLEVDPSHPLAHYTLAKCDRVEGDLEAAMQHLRTCVDYGSKLQRRLWKGWWRLGQLERLACGAQSAMARYQSVWECMGAKAHAACAYLALELCLEALADPHEVGRGGTPRDKALKLLNAYEDAVPHHSTRSWLMYYIRALMLEDISDERGARLLWAKAEQASTLSARCHGAVGDLLSAYGEVPLALQCYRREVSRVETTPERRLRLDRRIDNVLSGHSSLSVSTGGSWQSIAAAYAKLQRDERQDAHTPNLLY